MHDLHVYPVTSGFDSMSCHLVVEDMSVWRYVLREARVTVRQDFKIDHVTIEVEDGATMDEEAYDVFPRSPIGLIADGLGRPCTISVEVIYSLRPTAAGAKRPVGSFVRVSLR